MKYDWPKKHISWIENNTIFVSVPFTWELPKVKSILRQKSWEWNHAIVGGPAVYLQPDYFSEMSYVSIGYHHSGVLQRVNSLATKTTAGCFRRCGFCGVWRFEGKFRELSSWPDLPIICDNNLLASSIEHFDKVINLLRHHVGVDFNQGLDAKLLTKYHAKRIAEIKGVRKRGIRLALDNMAYSDHWSSAIERMQSAGIAKRKISSYALIGFETDPYESWARCEWIERQGIMALPMWFHALDALKKNYVTKDQEALGWNDYERRRIMQYFYQHKIAVAYEGMGGV